MSTFDQDTRDRCVALTGVDPDSSYRELMLDIHVGGPSYGRLQDSLASLDRKKPLPLSRQERRVAALVVLGCTNKEIGDVLYLGEETVKTYLKACLDKTGCRNRTSLAVWSVLKALTDNQLADTIEEMAA